MAEKDTAKKIAALGSLCGITSQYWDNFGRRHRTSQATYRDLLSAMGVDWEDPESLDREIARRRLGPWGALLEPVQLIKPAPAPAAGDGAGLVPRGLSPRPRWTSSGRWSARAASATGGRPGWNPAGGSRARRSREGSGSRCRCPCPPTWSWDITI